MYDMKALYEAENVEDAIRLLQEHPEAQIIAGGSDVLVQMREGKRAGKAGGITIKKPFCERCSQNGFFKAFQRSPSA